MKAITIIYGTEPYIMEERKKAFLRACKAQVGEESDIQVFQKDAAAAAVVEAFEGTSLFGGGSIVVWQDCPFLPLKRGGRSRSKITSEEEWFLDKVAALRSDECGLLLYTKGQVDTGSAFFKKIKDLADVTAAEAITEKNVMPYIQDFLEKKGKKLTVKGQHYLRDLFQTWDEIPLLYVFSELEKLCIIVGDEASTIDEAPLQDLFVGTMEKNLFTFMDYFLFRDGKHTLPFMEGLFSRQDLFLKNTGFMLSRLRLLLAYKELKAAHMGQHQCETIMKQINKGRSVNYVLYRLQKAMTYWKIEELYSIITNIFLLQRNIRRGTASVEDIKPLICLYCSTKGRV